MSTLRRVASFSWVCEIFCEVVRCQFGAKLSLAMCHKRRAGEVERGSWEVLWGANGRLESGTLWACGGEALRCVLTVWWRLES